MHHIIYLSRARHPLTEHQLASLLAQAQRNNQRNGVTGALLYGANQFIQLIEGEEAIVTQLYARIAADARHEGIVKLADKAVTARSFARWNMAFQAASPAQFAHLEGYQTLETITLHAPGLCAADDLLLHLLKSFVVVAHD